MPTSDEYGYSTSRDFIITEAFRKIGALGDGETIDSTRLDIGAGVLNPMVKALSAKGLNIWTLDKVTIPFSEWGGDPDLSVGPDGDYVMLYKPLKLLEAYRFDGATDIPLVRMSNRDYENQPNKITTGTPTMVYYKPDAYIGTLYLWQPPNSYWTTNGSLRCVFQRQIQDFTASGDEPDFPTEWHEALIYQLAARLAPNYGLPPNDRNALRAEAKELLEMALAFDQEEGSLFIQPDMKRKK